MLVHAYSLLACECAHVRVLVYKCVCLRPLQVFNDDSTGLQVCVCGCNYASLFFFVLCMCLSCFFVHLFSSRNRSTAATTETLLFIPSSSRFSRATRSRGASGMRDATSAEAAHVRRSTGEGGRDPAQPGVAERKSDGCLCVHPFPRSY